MHWIQVDEYRLPIRLSGHVALDFCNTWAGWGEPPDPRGEWLPDYDRLAVWTRYAELLDGGVTARLRRAALRRPDEAVGVLKASHSFRERLYWTLVGPGEPAKFRRVAEEVRRSATASVLVEDGEVIARWSLPPSLGLRLPLHAVARAAGDLVTSTDRSRIKACPGAQCGWLFLDPRGRRKWCSMESCGNRAKARAFTERQRGA